MKKKLILLLTIVLVFSLFVSCKKKATEEDYAQVVPVPEDSAEYDPESGIKLIPEGNGITYEEEMDGADIQYTKEDTSEFVGEWVADSDMANQLYGNVDIKINDDHTWSGNITDDEYSGEWTESENGIEIKVGFHDFGLAFSDSGNLVMTRYIPDGEDVYTVLVRKNADGSGEEE